MDGWGGSFEVVVVLVIRQREVHGLAPLLIQAVDLLLTHLNLLGSQCKGIDEDEVWISRERPQDPEEGLLVLVVALGGDVVILQSPLAMEGDLPGLDLAVLHIDLVPHHHDRQGLHHPRQVLVPLRHALVRDAGSDVEHQDGGIGPDVVALPETTEFLLAGGIPEVETDGPVGGVEGDRTDLHPLGSDVVLLELP